MASTKPINQPLHPKERLIINEYGVFVFSTKDGDFYNTGVPAKTTLALPVTRRHVPLESLLFLHAGNVSLEGDQPHIYFLNERRRWVISWKKLREAAKRAGVL